MNQENVKNQWQSLSFLEKYNKIFGYASVALLCFGFFYFLWYVFYGYDSIIRFQLLDAMAGFVDFKYFPINKNSPFFAFNFLIQFIVLGFIPLGLYGLKNDVQRLLFGDNLGEYDSAMNLIFDDERYRFRYQWIDDIAEYGWDNPSNFWDKPRYWLRTLLNLLFFKVKFIKKRLLPYLIKLVLKARKAETNDLLKAIEYLRVIKEDDALYGQACYHRALIFERFYFIHSSFDIQNSLLGAKKFFEDAIKNNIELAEYQFGMFLIQYTDKLSSDELNAKQKGIELLKLALTKVPVGREDIKNICHITLANLLANSEVISDLEEAMLFLKQVDVNEKLTAKFHYGEAFVKNPLASRSSERLDQQRDFVKANRGFSYMDTYQKIKQDKYGLNKKQILSFDYISVKDLNYTITENLDLARKKELYMATEAEKRKATENLMAMFAHKFRGPVDSIIFNTQHKHDERIYLDAARTMTGLLEVFSIVSTEPERLVDSMKSDVCGDGSPEKTILRSMKFALMQLLTRRNIKRMSRHYWQYALRCKLIPESTRFKDWNSESYLSILEIEIQEKLEMEVSSLTIEHGVEEIETWLRSNLMATEIQVSDTRQIRFSEYGRKEALLTTIMTELFVNAIKHTDVTSTQLFKVSWDEQADGLVFKCTNPSNRESRSGLSRGSGRGHSFLKMLLEKMQGQFEADVYQELSVVSVVIPYSLLIGERS